MKNLIVLSAACAAVLIVFAPKNRVLQSSYSIAGADVSGQGTWKDKYCASLKDGNIIVLNGKSELVVDITLANGSKITTDGFVVSKDGAKTALKNGDCVDKDGNIAVKNNSGKK